MENTHDNRTSKRQKLTRGAECIFKWVLISATGIHATLRVERRRDRPRCYPARQTVPIRANLQA